MAEIINIRVETEAQTGQLSKLQKEIQRLGARRSELNKKVRQGIALTKAEEREYATLGVNLKATRNRYRDLESSILKQNNALRKNSGFVAGVKKGVGQLATSFLGVTAVIGGAVAVISDAAKTIREFDENVANLRKTTGLADEEARALAKSLFTIDTRSSVTELLELATAAGRLGIAEEDIKDFVEEADKLFVALGDDLEGTAEEIATKIGRISSVFGVEAAEGVGEGLNKIGSAINELGATTKANAGFIVDFTNRMAGIAPAAGIGVQDVSGLGATLQELGQSAEVGASTLNKLIPAIGKDIPKFAKIAGVETEKFAKILKEDANEALLQVLSGARSTEGGVEGLAQTLSKLGIDSARAAGIVGALSENIDLVRKNQETANKAFEEGTSLTDEFAVKNETLDAAIGKLGNEWDKLVLSIEDGSGVIGGAIKGLVNGLSGVLELVQSFNEFTRSGFKGFTDAFIEETGVLDGAAKAAKANAREIIALEREKQDAILETIRIRLKEDLVAMNTASGTERVILATRIEGYKTFVKEIAKLRKQDKEEAKKTAEEEAEAAEEANEKAKNSTLKRLQEEARLRSEAEKFFQDTKQTFAELNDELADVDLTVDGISETEEGEVVESYDEFQASLRKTKDELNAVVNEIKNGEAGVSDLINAADGLASADIQAAFPQVAFLQAVQQRVADLVDEFANFASGLNDIAAIRLQTEQNIFNNRLEQEKKLRLESARTEEERAKIEEEFREKALEKEKVFREKQKQIAIKQAVIDGAAAGVKALTTGVPPFNIAQAALIAQKTKSQIELIQSQEFAEGGILQGKSHAQGGIPFTVAGQAGFEAEGGEAIINKKSTKMFAPLLSAINQAGGGIPFNTQAGTIFARGGVPNITTAAQRQVDGISANNDAIASINQRIDRLQVVNVATDTAQVNQQVMNVKNQATFG